METAPYSLSEPLSTSKCQNMYIEAVVKTTYSMKNSYKNNILGINISKAQYETKVFQFKLKSLIVYVSAV